VVGYAGSPTRTVYVGVTLTRSKVKVNITGLLISEAVLLSAFHKVYWLHFTDAVDKFAVI